MPKNQDQDAVKASRPVANHPEEFTGELPAVLDETRECADVDGYVDASGHMQPNEAPLEVAEAYAERDVELEQQLRDGAETELDILEPARKVFAGPL